GLFRAVIAQSGAAHHTLPATAGQVVADRFLEKLGAENVMHLEAASVKAILEAQRETSLSLNPGDPGMINELGVLVSPFFPVVGNEVLPESPLATIRGGLGAGIPVLVGSNYDETTLWGYGDVELDRLVKVAQTFGDAGLVDKYRDTRPDATLAELMIAMTTDHMFRIPAIRLAEARFALGESIWMYLFCWNSRAFEGRLKATHSLEIPFAFDNLDRSGVDVFLGDGATPQGIADVMHRAWMAFIRNGDPGWDKYDVQRRATMRFEEVSEVVNDPESQERSAWEGLR
ncbi:MAG: carboxylesterase family protein, partial [Deltaproteobacteria bacterium]|nr:carboxylesterase family protein [Deltaproteobacteria bacterium]